MGGRVGGWLWIWERRNGVCDKGEEGIARARAPARRHRSSWRGSCSRWPRWAGCGSRARSAAARRRGSEAAPARAGPRMEDKGWEEARAERGEEAGVCACSWRRVGGSGRMALPRTRARARVREKREGQRVGAGGARATFLNWTRMRVWVVSSALPALRMKGTPDQRSLSRYITATANVGQRDG